MITEYLLEKALNASLEAAKRMLKGSSVKLSVTRDDIEQSISHHLRGIKNWSEEISFTDLKKAKRTTDIFIELDLFVYPRRVRIQTEEIENIPLRDIFDYDKHFILLGQPGAGKTTSMRYLCQKVMFDEDFHSDKFSFPILIKLRELNIYEDKVVELKESNIKEKKIKQSVVFDQLFDVLGLKLKLPGVPPENDEYIITTKSIKRRLVVSLLEELRVLLILDGFDELAQNEIREEVVHEITYLVTHLDQSSVLVTSRTGDFVYSIDNAAQYEICPLNSVQIEKFAGRWLNNAPEASEFLNKVHNSPFADTAIRPLTLAHLCAIYEREGKIPDKPKTIYRKIVNLLLEEWDQQRSVKRLSKYANFEVDRKFEFLCRLAYELTVFLLKTVFSRDDLLNVYDDIYQDFGLLGHEAQQVVNELETHTGLFLQSGYERYEFAHKSLQEYLTAEYLVKLPSIPDAHILARLPSELAIVITISSNASNYFAELILSRLMWPKLPEAFFKAFLSRLLLEKPDLSSSEKLSVALIIFISVYIEYNIVSDDELQQVYFSKELKEFEDFIKPVLCKNTLEIIEGYYDTAHTYEMEGGKIIQKMIVRKESSKARNRMLANAILPEMIYLDLNLLQETL